MGACQSARTARCARDNVAAPQTQPAVMDVADPKPTARTARCALCDAPDRATFKHGVCASCFERLGAAEAELDNPRRPGRRMALTCGVCAKPEYFAHGICEACHGKLNDRATLGPTRYVPLSAGAGAGALECDDCDATHNLWSCRRSRSRSLSRTRAIRTHCTACIICNEAEKIYDY